MSAPEEEPGMQKIYLGDSVYVEIENEMVKLTTDNGEGPSNTIFLDEAVLLSLLDFLVSASVIDTWTAYHS